MQTDNQALTEEDLVEYSALSKKMRVIRAKMTKASYTLIAYAHQVGYIAEKPEIESDLSIADVDHEAREVEVGWDGYNKHGMPYEGSMVLTFDDLTHIDIAKKNIDQLAEVKAKADMIRDEEVAKVQRRQDAIKVRDMIASDAMTRLVKEAKSRGMDAMEYMEIALKQ